MTGRKREKQHHKFNKKYISCWIGFQPPLGFLSRQAVPDLAVFLLLRLAKNGNSVKAEERQERGMENVQINSIFVSVRVQKDGEKRSD